nr:immunoglobulin light chain junction region [Macaca mulatta]
CQIYISSPFTF